MKKLIIITCLGLAAVACGELRQSGGDTDRQVKIELSLAGSRFQNLLNYEVDSLKFPRSLEKDGSVRERPSSDWTSGFYPGSLLYIYRLTSDEAYFEAAKKWLPFIVKEKWNDRTHDMGFKVYCSLGNANEIEPSEELKSDLLQSAKTLASRYNPTVGCIKSWDFGKDRWQYPVIIDNMMNLELLFEATRLSNDSSYYYKAVSHATNTMANHYRPDYSSYHVIDYDEESGQVRNRLTHQGIDVESVWSRGQAWGLYGFTMVYRYTKNPIFLDHAIHIAEFIMGQENMPADFIPYWDMKDPDIPNVYRDASAAAISASALFELSAYSGNDHYSDYASKILHSLNSDSYVIAPDVDVPFILKHSTGDYPKNDELDVPISYADYYFLEAMYRSKTGLF